MLGFIIWIIIICWIMVSFNKKKGKKSGNGRSMTGTNRTVIQRTEPSGQAMGRQAPPSQLRQVSSSQSQVSSRPKQISSAQPEPTIEDLERQRELKERLRSKYRKDSGSDILERAKMSVSEDFNENKAYDKKVEDTTDAGGKRMDMQNVIYGNPKNQQKYQQLQNHQQNPTPQTAEVLKEDLIEEDVLYKVQQLMVMGPDCQVTFERDFLSEGMDMLNRIQM